MSQRRPRTAAVIGAGAIAPAHVTGWQALGTEVVLFSTTGTDAVELAAVSGARLAGSFDEAIDQADVVSVCTPTPTHPAIVAAAAEAGRDVVCEKPLALTADQAETMISGCERAGVALFPAHVVRFMEPYRTAYDHVARGGLGRLASQRFLRVGGRPGPERGWFADPAQSGGLVMDFMIHDLDIARWIGGEVRTVFARATDTLDDPEATVSAHAILTHENGVVSQCTGIWRFGGEFDTRYAIAGDDGVIDYELSRYPGFALRSRRPAEPGSYVPTDRYAASPYSAEIAAFAAALDGGPPPAVSAADGLAAVRLAEAANESIRTGRPVELSGVPR